MVRLVAMILLAMAPTLSTAFTATATTSTFTLLPTVPISNPSSSASASAHRYYAHHYSRSTSTALQMGLLDMFQPKEERSSSSSGKKANRATSAAYKLQIHNEIGSGSYGVVHLCQLLPPTINNANTNNAHDDNASSYRIAKRAWTKSELLQQAQEAAQSATTESIDDADTSSIKSKVPNQAEEERIRQLGERCAYYLDVERHCLEKLGGSSAGETTTTVGEGRHVPTLVGVYPDDENRDWLVFDLVQRTSSTDKSSAAAAENADADSSSPKPARTLYDILQEDWVDQRLQRDDVADNNPNNAHHHLYVLQKELGMAEESTFGDVLDKTLVELLRTVCVVNAANIVHRDVKPSNLLITTQGFVLIDFGSAGDVDPSSTASSAMTAFSSVLGGNGNRVGLQDDGVVALSPIYAAPETYVRWDRAPLNFDSFSTALVFAQLLFNLLDERADASFRQQLEDEEFDLDSWLQRELSAELQPDGIEDAVVYLGERPGLWAVLRDMLRPNPERRLSTSEALRRVEKILLVESTAVEVGIEEADGKFFAGVVALFEQCEIPDEGSAIGVEAGSTAAAARNTQNDALTGDIMPRPLHYVATFSRSESLGLVLAEVEPDGLYDDDSSEEDNKMWEDATADAEPGTVFVRGIVEGGQAQSIGVFDIGDKLGGVGEFPFLAEGFTTVVDMLQAQPPSAKTVTLHFARKSVGRAHDYERTAPHLAKVVGQGAWSARGRRKTQEDRFVLQEVHDGNNAALLTGVFDGHGGNSASTTLAQLLPSLFSVELAGLMSVSTTGKAKSSDLREAMASAYEITCNTYRNGCDEEGGCVADYDPRQGIVLAGMGSTDLVAGSTVTVAVLGVSEDGADELSVLNCGDSRTLAVGRPRGEALKDSVVYFSTRDHSPSCQIEMTRLARDKEKGYSQPKCSMSRWRMKVGDYQYAIARSLEGSFATSKGIVSDPDISTVDLSEMLTERELCSVVMASDGLFEVVDNEEAGRDVCRWREEGQSADEVAKQLCRKAVEKGSSDNVSVVVLYLD